MQRYLCHSGTCFWSRLCSAGVLPASASAAQDSLGSFVSSMIMSLNSLDSKISPHSLHSTNSESSSRATICTRGCLHCGVSLLLSGSGDGGDGVINPGVGIPFKRLGISPEIGGILDRLLQLSSPSVDLYSSEQFFSCPIVRLTESDSKWRSLQRLSSSSGQLAVVFRPLPVTGCI